MSYIEFQNITKEYNTGGNAIFALKDASFSVEKGELAIILGASGAGKTRSIVIPNLLQESGSYILSDPKGNLYKKYGPYLKKQ